MKYFPHPEKPNCWITKDELFKIYFGEEFMNSTDKGTIKQYEDEQY